MVLVVIIGGEPTVPFVAENNFLGNLLAKIEFFVKSRNFLSKIKIFVQNRNLLSKIDFVCQKFKFLYKIEICCLKRFFCQKSKFYFFVKKLFEGKYLT